MRGPREAKPCRWHVAKHQGFIPTPTSPRGRGCGAASQACGEMRPRGAAVQSWLGLFKASSPRPELTGKDLNYSVEICIPISWWKRPGDPAVMPAGSLSTQLLPAPPASGCGAMVPAQVPHSHYSPSVVSLASRGVRDLRTDANTNVPSQSELWFPRFT